MQGFRPKNLKGGQAGFSCKMGRCYAPRRRQETTQGFAKHFLIIDEINRGNLAKVFGEFYFLLEYRDKKISMQYQQEGSQTFSLPENLYIIGTMNTADRSIALVDLALRRRFYFVEFHPDDEPVKGVLRKWLKQKDLDNMEWVADVVDKANELLLKDDRHAAIGPSYFMKERLDKRWSSVSGSTASFPTSRSASLGMTTESVRVQIDKCEKVAPQSDGAMRQREGKDPGK